MSTWLRLTLVGLTVGGGFTGVVLTLQMLFSPQVDGAALILICVLFVVLYLFVFLSGLLLVHNPRRVTPLAIALVLQVPVVSSPVVAFRFAAGLQCSFGLSQGGVFAGFRLGSEWQFNLLQPLPLALGVNVVAVLLLVALIRSTARNRQRSATGPPPLPA